MSRNLKLLLVLVAVAAALYFVVVNKPWKTFKGELKDFAIKDTAAITKIFLADTKGKTVLLEKKEDGSWKLNGKYPADLTKVTLLKATMHDINIRNPLTQNEFNTTVAMMASDAVKAEFYDKKGLIKTVYVGSQTPDQTGTFMMLEGSSTPFVMHVPGFVGYLSPRFSSSFIKWKSRELFNIPAEQIATISITYPREPAASFVLDNSGNSPVVKDQSGNAVPADPGFTRYYLGGFNGLFFEGYVDDVRPAENDSVRALIPFCVLEIKTKDGASTKLMVHYKGVDRSTKKQYDEVTGEKLPFDTDKYIGYINDETEMIFVQQYNFGRLFIKAGDFAMKGKRAG